MEDDFEVELENNQETGSETPENEEPADNGDKQDQPSDESKDEAASEEASKEEDAGAKDESPDKPKFDEDLDEWAAKKGKDKPENDRERKLLQDLRNSDRQFTQDREAKKNADKLNETVKSNEKPVVEDADDKLTPEQKRISALEQQTKDERAMRLRSEFTIAHNLSEETVTTMAKIFEERLAKATSIQAKEKVIEYFNDTDNLQDWLDLAEAREIKASGKDQIVDEATKKERARIAKLSNGQGSAPRNAKNTVPKDQQSELDKLWSE